VTIVTAVTGVRAVIALSVVTALTAVKAGIECHCRTQELIVTTFYYVTGGYHRVRRATVSRLREREVGRTGRGEGALLQPA